MAGAAASGIRALLARYGIANAALLPAAALSSMLLMRKLDGAVVRENRRYSRR